MTAPHPIPRASYAGPLARDRRRKWLAEAAFVACHIALIALLGAAALRFLAAGITPAPAIHAIAAQP